MCDSDYILFPAVLCGTPPAVENAHLIGRRRSHYDIHAVVRYQCAEGFFQRHIPTARCRADGSWERPKIICTKCECSVWLQTCSVLFTCYQFVTALIPFYWFHTWGFVLTSCVCSYNSKPSVRSSLQMILWFYSGFLVTYGQSPAFWCSYSIQSSWQYIQCNSKTEKNVF